jgi:fructose-1,6-bisphosphatase I
MATNPSTSSSYPLTSTAWIRAHCPQDHRDSLPQLISAVESACRRIASRVQRAGLEGLYGYAGSSQQQNASGDQQKKLDVVSDEIFAAALAESGLVRAYASEEADAPVVLAPASSSLKKTYAVVFDPLDGSRNVDVAIPTGTIFGIYESVASGPAYGEEEALEDCLQQGSNLVASGYCLYSSSVVLALATATGGQQQQPTAAFFALDTLTGDFLATHNPVLAPKRGQIYSLNDARFGDWPPGLQRYISDVRSGQGATKKQYSARYVCSLVADLHRTLLQGGWCGNPRSHLRLVYEGNPLAFLVEATGGKASDGKKRVLEIVPEKTHQRLPLFLGSTEDIDELESYGDVQQIGEKKYAV